MKNKKDIKFQKEFAPKFELVTQVRDLQGNPTGQTRHFLTDDPVDLEEFWQRNCYREKKVDEKPKTGRPKNRRHPDSSKEKN